MDFELRRQVSRINEPFKFNETLNLNKNYTYLIQSEERPNQFELFQKDKLIEELNS